MNLRQLVAMFCLSFVFSTNVFADESFSAEIKELEIHLASMNVIHNDIKSVTNAAQAATFEANLKQKIGPFLAQVKKVDSHGPNVMKALKAPNPHPDVIQAHQRLVNMSANVYPSLSKEFERVEKLHPSLKATFDQIRNMHKQ